MTEGERMDYMTELAAIAKKHSGIIETKTEAQHGISKAMLYKLCKEEKISRIAKGQYILLNDLQDELLSITNRFGKNVFLTKLLCFSMGFLTVHLLNEPQHYSQSVDKVLLWWYNSKKASVEV